jgi:hypothetical protein
VVDWGTALAIAKRVEGTDCQVVLVKDGDHRLSRPQDIALLTRIVEGLDQEPQPPAARMAASPSR